MDLFRFFTPVRLAKALYGVVVAAIVAEIGLAIVYRQEEALQRDLVSRDDVLGFRMVPNYDGTIGKTGIPLKTNSWGVRDREYGAPPAGGVRVLVIGDSMVFGQGIAAEETFPRKLEPILSERMGVPVEVVNGGIPGYGTTQTARFLEQVIDKIQPDLVLMCVAVFNDVSDNLKFKEQLHRWQGKRSIARQIRWFFRHNSQLYILLRRYRAGVSGQQMMDIHAVDPSARTREGLGLIEESVRAAKRIADDRRVPFAVMINPGQTQASEKAWASALTRYQLPEELYSYEQPNQRLRQTAEAESIPVLDLLPAFRRSVRQDYYHSEHWIPEGQVFVASEIASFFDTSGLFARARSRRTEPPGTTGGTGG